MQSLFSLLASRSASSSVTGCKSKPSASNTSEAAWTESANSGPTLSAPGSAISLRAIASLPETRRLVVTAALDDLFRKEWFDVCNLDKVMKICNAPRGSEAHQLLDALHCVHYGRMPPDLRARIPHLVNECLCPPEAVQGVATTIALQGVDV